jgi:hypothetical protein
VGFLAAGESLHRPPRGIRSASAGLGFVGLVAAAPRQEPAAKTAQIQIGGGVDQLENKDVELPPLER